ncbi:Terminal EAR1-like 2 [Quillaja saponaria]|uniref:Terminal EAR1-like 2 n=1 Tax=Quillaja saponaria TaxID=32244 RepID=A0AAD7QBL9_QUISA|nr:Terminal EAR1-like 2 [Quillaja saponaria]
MDTVSTKNNNKGLNLEALEFKPSNSSFYTTFPSHPLLLDHCYNNFLPVSQVSYPHFYNKATNIARDSSAKGYFPLKKGFFGGKGSGGGDGFRTRGRRKGIHNCSCVFQKKQIIKPQHDHQYCPPDYGRDTTIMLKNIPNKYTRDLLVNFMEDHCKAVNQKEEEKDCEEKTVSAFDLLYLPIDFKSGLNKGYAFINFTNPKAVWKFYLAKDDKKWELFESKKRCAIARARFQGKEQLMKHFKGMVFPCNSHRVLPVLFNPPMDGSGHLVSQRTIGSLSSLIYHIN